jgi:hypothetical protein
MPELDIEFIPEIGPKQFKWTAFTNLILKGLKEGVRAFHGQFPFFWLTTLDSSTRADQRLARRSAYG